jgi:hypothetical protein
VLAQVRNSLAGPQPSLAYEVTAADGALPTVNWLGTVPTAVDDLLAGGTARANAPRDRVAAFLEQFLAAGPRTSQEIWTAAQHIGLAERTLRRARNGLGLRFRRVAREGRPVSYWLLRGQVLPEGISDMPEIDRAIVDLEWQWAPPTPLDVEDEVPDDE